MLLKRKNLTQIISNNISHQTSSDSKDKVPLEATVPLAEWLKNVPQKIPSTKIVPKNLSIIYSLNLSRSSLSQFPQEIIQLTSLKFLILDENSISVIPKNLGTLNNLEMLSIANNRLEGVGSWIMKLNKLTYLNLSKNHIHLLSEDLRCLNGLETLLIQENTFEKLPLFFHELTNLKELGLDWFLFLSPSLEKTVVQKEKDPIFKNLMFFLKKRVEYVSFQEFLAEFSEKKNCQMDPIFKLLNRAFLYKCANNNNLGVLSVILKKSPNLMNEANEEGYGLMAYALLNKNQYLPELLLQLNCNLIKGYGNYNSALNLAITLLNSEMCLTLLKSGENLINNIDGEGNTPLHLLFDGRFSQLPQSKAKEICHLLLESGVYPNLENKAKYTAIHLAIKNGEIQAIEWALKYNKRKKSKNRDCPVVNLFDFDKKFGAFSFTAIHYAIFLGKYEIVEVMSQYPDEVDFFERCKTGKTPKQVAYKSLCLIKICMKCEKNWVKSKILSSVCQNSNINRIPEGIMVNEMLENKLSYFERPKARSEFHKANANKFQPEKIVKEACEVDDFDESPMTKGSRIILQVKTLEKAPNDIAIMNNRLCENHELDESLKIQNQILLNIQYKNIEAVQLEKILKNLMDLLNSSELIMSERLSVFFYIRLFQFKLNLWAQKFNSKMLPYSVFLINTFFNSNLKPYFFQKRHSMLRSFLVNYVEGLMKETNTRDKHEDKENPIIITESQNQFLLSEFLRVCLDASQNLNDNDFSYENLLNRHKNSILTNYEIFQAHHYLNYLKNAGKTDKSFKPKLLLQTPNIKTKFINNGFEKPKLDMTPTKNTTSVNNSQKLDLTPKTAKAILKNTEKNLQTSTTPSKLRGANNLMTQKQKSEKTPSKTQGATPNKNETNVSINNPEKKKTHCENTNINEQIISKGNTIDCPEKPNLNLTPIKTNGQPNKSKNTNLYIFFPNNNQIETIPQKNNVCINKAQPTPQINNACITQLDKHQSEKIPQITNASINTNTEKQVKETNTTTNKADHPNLKSLYLNGKKVCVGVPKNQLIVNDEDITVIETARRSSLKAYYFPSKQDFSPFQTKEKGGLK